jgi:hypothetical protein
MKTVKFSALAALSSTFVSGNVLPSYAAGCNTKAFSTIQINSRPNLLNKLKLAAEKACTEWAEDNNKKNNVNGPLKLSFTGAVGAQKSAHVSPPWIILLSNVL